MLRITKTSETRHHVHLVLEGKVAAQWAALLDDVCRAHIRDRKVVQLDCAGVDFVDGNGVDVLKNFTPRQVKLLRTPGFMNQLLHNGE